MMDALITAVFGPVTVMCEACVIAEEAEKREFVAHCEAIGKREG
jgi:hypothetical protein